jgi:transposase
MQTQFGLKRNTFHRRYALGAHPIIHTYMNRLGVADIIGSHIKHDMRRKLSCEKTISLIVHNILTTPMPLYEFQDWLKPLDADMLGLIDSEVPLINDDRVGKALEDFYFGKHKDVFFHLALKAIKLFKLDCSQIHQDTTSITFAGKYGGWSAEEILTYGHNKDHRPDLKQLVLGMSVTADGGVPIVHKVYNGNQSDDKLHLDNHQRLRKLLGRADFIYVADCKLATAENLRQIAAFGGRFVSIMPRSWKEDKLFRTEIKLGKIEWTHLLSKKNSREPKGKIDRYELANGQYFGLKDFSIHWLRSSQKAEQDAETRLRRIDKTNSKLMVLQTRLNRYHLKTREEIAAAVLKITKESQTTKFFTVKIESFKNSTVQHKAPGRPKLGAVGTKAFSRFFSLGISVDEDAIVEDSLDDGVFPLITNLGEAYDAKDALNIYKYQPFLEKRHSQLKSYQEIAPVYLKKAERVVALLHVHVLALMISALIEREIRQAMRKKKIESLPIYPEGRACKSPTMFDIVRIFRDVERFEVEQNGSTTIFPAQLTKAQTQILSLLNVPASLFH